jgi:phosphoribosylformimino-5-aminoimidazole carboxamide ribotide isomerase
MKFRPCIDIHNGKVKQLVGGSLKDKGNIAKENYVSEKSAADFARMYKSDKLTGGHIIILNSKDSSYYEETKKQALEALNAYRGGMQIGGGVTADNAKEYIENGASHVIVTSYVFRNGIIDFERLNRLKDSVGKEHVVLDLSCRKKNGKYYVVTDRWQNFTSEYICEEFLDKLTEYCDEFLVHGVDVEGKSSGMDMELVKLLCEWNKIPTTYAGGIHSFQQIDQLNRLGKGKIDFTIGSALDMFGGNIPYDKMKKII